MADNGRSNNNPMKAITVIVTIVALIGGMAAIVEPMRNQIAAQQALINKLEKRFEKEDEKLDRTLQREMELMQNTVKLSIEEHKKSFGHPQLHNEVKELWKYHKHTLDGTP